MKITVTLNLLSLLPLPAERTTLTFPIDAATTTTIRDAIAWVDAEHPGFAAAVVGAGGDLSREFVFFVNGTNIHSLGGLQALLKANDVVNVIPAIAGG